MALHIPCNEDNDEAASIFDAYAHVYYHFACIPYPIVMALGLQLPCTRRAAPLPSRLHSMGKCLPAGIYLIR